jgi:uncharacterized membrane protein
MRRVGFRAAHERRSWAIRDKRLLFALVGLAAAACVGACLLQKAPCWTGSVRGIHPSCVDDSWSLFKLRGLADHGFPYLHPGSYGLPRGTVEYPVLTGVFAWLVALPVDNATSYLFVESAVMCLVAVCLAIGLAHLSGRRALLFAASPALALYAVHNWDLLPVLAVVLGLAAWHRRRPELAAVAFAVGACLKLYPALFVLPLLADLRVRSQRRQRARVAGVFVGTAALINAPFLVLAPHQWFQVLRYQSLRPADISAMSVWSTFGTDLPISVVNASSGLAMLLAVALVMAYASSRVRDCRYPVLQTCAALTVAFLVTNKTCSPQAMLWLLPFFVLLDVRIRWWALFAAVDVITWFAFLRTWHGPSFGIFDGSATQIDISVMLRLLVLLALLPQFFRAREAWVVAAPPDDRIVSAGGRPVTSARAAFV